MTAYAEQKMLLTQTLTYKSYENNEDIPEEQVKKALGKKGYLNIIAENKAGNFSVAQNVGRKKSKEQQDRWSLFEFGDKAKQMLSTLTESDFKRAHNRAYHAHDKWLDSTLKTMQFFHDGSTAVDALIVPVITEQGVVYTVSIAQLGDSLAYRVQYNKKTGELTLIPFIDYLHNLNAKERQRIGEENIYQDKQGNFRLKQSGLNMGGCFGHPNDWHLQRTPECKTVEIIPSEDMIDAILIVCDGVPEQMDVYNPVALKEKLIECFKNNYTPSQITKAIVDLTFKGNNSKKLKPSSDNLTAMFWELSALPKIDTSLEPVVLTLGDGHGAEGDYVANKTVSRLPELIEKAVIQQHCIKQLVVMKAIIQQAQDGGISYKETCLLRRKIDEFDKEIQQDVKLENVEAQEKLFQEIAIQYNLQEKRLKIFCEIEEKSAINLKCKLITKIEHALANKDLKHTKEFDSNMQNTLLWLNENPPTYKSFLSVEKNINTAIVAVTPNAIEKVFISLLHLSFLNEKKSKASVVKNIDHEKENIPVKQFTVF